MNLANEAGYLYVLSKKLTWLNRRIKRCNKKAEKHAHRQAQAADQYKKHKHRIKHEKTKIVIHHLLKEHHALLTKIKHHKLAFTHALAKEHKT